MRRRVLVATTLVGTALGFTACSHEWPAYRYGAFRTGAQPYSSDLSNASRVGSLAVRWTFPPGGSARDPGHFLASPIVMKGIVYIGSTSGRFYALDAATGVLKWQYPVPPAPPLVPSDPTFSYGIASSATYWDNGANGAVVFGGQDPSLGPYGGARLFALDAQTGALLWQSDPVAQSTGHTGCSTSEVHEKIGYSSPLIFNNKVYIGVSDHGDNPIQGGKVVAVNLSDGHIASGFDYHSVATGARGGAVWNAPATDLSGVFFTTGNTRADSCATYSEPSPNHGLSMIRVDKDTGGIVWKFQPVPFHLDDDPDWSAGASVMFTSCGTLVASVQKDGYAYAVNAGNGVPGSPSVTWQFPPTGFPFSGGTHGDDDYKRPGAAWNDVLVITAGGEALVHDGVAAGYGRLHALNVCEASEANRVRWLLDVPHNSFGGYALGAPTVSGGIVYVGTDQGHLVVIADPSVAPAVGYRCSNIDYISSASCTAAGYVMVPIPQILADVTVGDGASLSGLRSEPALADGRVFVGSDGGRVYMLSPDATTLATNACGGTMPLYAIPGTACEDAGQCGRWKCPGPNANAVTCDTKGGARNECGGCNPMPLPASGHGRGDSCFCNNPALSEGTLVCGPKKGTLICCPCNSAPGCGPGSP